MNNPVSSQTHSTTLSTVQIFREPIRTLNFVSFGCFCCSKVRKFEYNAPRATLIHLNELKEILRNETTDDEDKVWAAREKIFGPRSNLIEPKP